MSGRNKDQGYKMAEARMNYGAENGVEALVNHSADNGVNERTPEPHADRKSDDLHETGQMSERSATAQQRHRKIMKRHSVKNSMVADRIELFTEILEIVIAVIILVGFVVSVVPLLKDLPGLVDDTADLTFQAFLEHAFDLIIGIEFVRMLIKHTPASALDVLLFAISRHMVLEGANGVELLLGVAAIGGIFAIRKFLFVRSFESDEGPGEMEEEAKEELAETEETSGT